MAHLHKWHHLTEDEKFVLIMQTLEKIMADTTALTAAVAANTAAVTDVQAVVGGLRSSDDQAAVDAATAQITTNTAALEALKTPPSA
jgi:hypothetical protein